MRVELSKDETTAHIAQQLLQIDEGTYPTDQTTGLIELNSDFCNTGTTKNELIDQIYPNIVHNYTNLGWLHFKGQFWQVKIIMSTTTLTFKRKFPVRRENTNRSTRK